MQAMVNKHTGRAIVKYGDQTVQHRNMLIAHISREWGDKPPVTGPLAIGAHFLFPRPKGHYGSGRNAGKLKDSAPEYVTKAPDTDKLMRLLCDAVDIAGICEDDAQFVAISHLESLRTGHRLHRCPVRSDSR